jgi:hypothetical protein
MKVFLVIVCLCIVAACGHSAGSSSIPSTSVTSATESPIGASPTTSAAVAPAAAPGCGIYCQQAGNSAGNGPPGYPCPSAGCLKCPPQNCVTLESGGATIANGMTTVKLTCNLSTACRGAFLICLPTVLCEIGSTEMGAGGRLAGSDFVIPPGITSDVGVAFTALGKQVVSGPSAYNATVLVDLLNYGTVLNTTNSNPGNFGLISTDPPTYPAGATASCGATLFVGPDTSCPFAENVEKAYSNSVGNGNGTVNAFSPVTGETYKMRCTGVSPHVCRGGTNALVEFYH